MQKLKMVLIIGVAILVILMIGFFTIFFREGSQFKDIPVHEDPKIVGYVPDSATAIKIAEAIWLPIYGDDIYYDVPFVASLEDSVWHVVGTLRPGARGGVAEAYINKFDGRVIRVFHGR